MTELQNLSNTIETQQELFSTPEELALTYPPGYHGDPEAELDRRPGTDT